MAISMNSFYRLILITGEPGVGKTTLVKRLHDKLKKDENGLANKITGFYTDELRNEQTNLRVGFDVINLNDDTNRAPLARCLSAEAELINMRDAPKVGKYCVDVASFERVALPLINPNKEAFIYMIDEVGKMESFSSAFEKSVEQLIQQEKSLIVATVPIRSLKLSDKLKSHPSAKLFTVTRQNRNNVLNQVLDAVIASHKKTLN